MGLQHFCCNDLGLINRSIYEDYEWMTESKFRIKFLKPWKGEVRIGCYDAEYYDGDEQLWNSFSIALLFIEFTIFTFGESDNLRQSSRG